METPAFPVPLVGPRNKSGVTVEANRGSLTAIPVQMPIPPLAGEDWLEVARRRDQFSLGSNTPLTTWTMPFDWWTSGVSR